MSIFKGAVLTVNIFGRSHDAFVGAEISGFPAGFSVDMAALQTFLARRSPGRSPLTSGRCEPDIPQFISGLSGGVTTGETIRIQFENRDVRRSDYRDIADLPRPSHADYPARVKFGDTEDLSGGGKFSGRLTAPLCAAGGIALQLLAAKGITVAAHLAAVSGICDAAFDETDLCAADLLAVTKKPFPAIDEGAGAAMQAAIRKAADDRDSVGGIIECAAVGLPVGLGDALFDGAESRLAAALFAIPAVKGVEFGAGFAAAGMRGSEHNDPYAVRDGKVVTLTNHAGGLAGGMTTGMPLIVRAAVKPTPSIGLPQKTVDLATMKPAELTVGGRHDPCVALRALPAVEAAVALVLWDMMGECGYDT